MKRAPSLVLAFAVLLALALSIACSRDRGTTPACGADDGAAPLDTDVMAFLSEARALHHEANVKEDANDLPGAIAALDRLVQAKHPHDGSRIPEIEEVLADTYARRAELRLRNHDALGAEGDVRDGLLHAPDATYFRGHLLEVDGIVAEARAAELADAGKPDEAAKERARALDRLNQAVEVQGQVVARSLGAADGGANAARVEGGQP